MPGGANLRERPFGGSINVCEAGERRKDSGSWQARVNKGRWLFPFPACGVGGWLRRTTSRHAPRPVIARLDAKARGQWLNHSGAS